MKSQLQIQNTQNFKNIQILIFHINLFKILNMYILLKSTKHYILKSFMSFIKNMKKLCIKKIETKINLRDLFALVQFMILKTLLIMKESLELPRQILQEQMKEENSKMKACIQVKEASIITIESMVNQQQWESMTLPILYLMPSTLFMIQISIIYVSEQQEPFTKSNS